MALTRILVVPLLLFLASATLLTFYVDHQVQQPLDYVEISAVVKADGDSLEAAIEEAAGTITKIEALLGEYCRTYTPKHEQKDCKDMIEVSPYSIKPQYQALKNKQAFTGFVVAHEIFQRVRETEGFGKLVDDILKIGVNKINSLEWKPKEEVSGEEIALEEGLQQAHQICNKIGSRLAKIVSAQEVTDFGVDEEEGEKDESESEQDEQPLDIADKMVYYKFVVECQRSKGK